MGGGNFYVGRRRLVTRISALWIHRLDLRFRETSGWIYVFGRDFVWDSGFRERLRFWIHVFEKDFVFGFSFSIATSCWILTLCTVHDLPQCGMDLPLVVATGTTDTVEPRLEDG